jgi:LysM repeat protein
MTALGVIAAACGGGSSGTKAPDASKIATATLPATLPQPRIVSSGAAQPGGGSSYTVKDGDTLAGIAAKFGFSLDDLLAANPDVSASSLSIGQTLKLPAAPIAPTTILPTTAPATAAAKTPAPATSAPTTEPATAAAPSDTPVPAATGTPSSLGQTYTVQAGDYPATIAAKFGITVEALLAANPGIDPTNLQIGQVLIIPPKPAG